jgi:hypothetical protein
MAMTAIERRGHSRKEMVMAIMISPNGGGHSADLLDLSEGGVRVGLSIGWTPAPGTLLRMYFRLDACNQVSIEGRVTRVAVDHLGLEFAPAQEAQIQSLLSSAERFS